VNTLERRIRDAQGQGRLALVPFLTAGFPDGESFWPILMELEENGADIIEIGIPFSDPVADGPVVEEASRRALADGVTLRAVLDELRQRRSFFKAGIVLMGYLNPFLQHGYERLVADASAAGVDGFIVPDMPYEESGAFKAMLAEAGIALIPLVGPNTPRKRMELYARDCEGYVYVVSVMGTTGERAALPPEAAATLRLAHEVFDRPLALGFGLKHPAQLAGLGPKERPEAAVFGSALLRHIDAGRPAGEFLQQWRAAGG
jgi:tryptophan synthase alpha chain